MYATLADLVTRFGETALAQLTDRENAATPDPATIEAALTDASELIDAYAAERYALPLSPVPAPVRRWCADIAFYMLHGDTCPDKVRQDYEVALKGLKDMSKGVVLFQSAGKASPGNPGSAGASFTAPARVFTGESLHGF
jgi:phage gp36-like protein